MAHNCPLCEASVPVSLQYHFRDPEDRNKVIVITLSPKTIDALKAIGVDLTKFTLKERKNGN